MTYWHAVLKSSGWAWLLGALFVLGGAIDTFVDSGSDWPMDVAGVVLLGWVIGLLARMHLLTARYLNSARDHA